MRGRLVEYIQNLDSLIHLSHGQQCAGVEFRIGVRTREQLWDEDGMSSDGVDENTDEEKVA